MYRLTIDRADNETTTSSEHPDPSNAKHALARYVEQANCRTDTIQAHPDFSSWDLITLTDNRIHATATIEQVSRDPVEEADFAALKGVLDDAVAIDSAAPLVDACEPTVMQLQWDTVTGASLHFHRAS